MRGAGCKNLCAVADRGIFTFGKFNREFEKPITRVFGVKHCPLWYSGSSVKLLTGASLSAQNWEDGV